jgi:type I restriction enzyme S subunit
MSKAEFEFDLPATLPDGWKWMPLEDLMDQPKQDIVDGPFGSNLKASEYVEEGIPIARLQNVDRNIFIHKNIKYVTRKKAEELSRHTFKSGDILITKLGDPLGEACIAPSSIEHGVIVADLVRVRPAVNKVDRHYLTYAINSPLVARQFEKHTKGTTRPRVNLGMIRKLPIPVAPREMQAGVVAEIEKQFSRLDEAVANLKRVRANLKRYKAAVLKAAVEGRLVETEAELARREGRSYETGAQLLQRILETRRSQWTGKGKYKEPAAPDTTDLPELPEGWVWANVDQLAEVGTGATPKRDQARYYGGDIPWVTSAVVNDTFVDHAGEFVTSEALAETNLTLYPSGTLLVAMYGEGKTRGKCSELRIPVTTNQALAALQADKRVRAYLKLFLDYNYEETRKVASGGVQPNLNLSLVRAVRVPFPPLAEQHRIVAEVDRHLSLLRVTEAQVDANFRRAERLCQSILNSAFSTSQIEDK